MTRNKKIGLTLTLFVLAVVGIGVGLAARVLQARHGEQTGQGRGGFIQSMQDATQIAISPKEGFPGQDKLVILCMGIDDNWTDKDEVYTAQARTDTLFLLTLDLADKRATMLSIPRDTYCHIAGTKDRYFKINEAYETGGPERAIATVNELLGVHADHFLVLNIDATKRMVDALGGVDVDVPHEMHYHDKWGHLSIDLLPGPQHLDGNAAVGFARYRHPDAGKKPTPEDGDERRMARQHILMKAMVEKAKSFANVAQAPHLIDVGMSSIRTDLTRTQLFDLAAIFRGIQPEEIQTASLTGEDFRGPDGAWLYRLYPDKAKAYVDWLVKGDPNGARRLCTVVVKNGTSVPGLAARVVEQLKQDGYTDVQNGGNTERPAIHMAAQKRDEATVARTHVMDTGVPNPQAAADVLSLLGLTDAPSARIPLKPNKMGWTPPATLTLTLGQDYAAAVKGTADTATAAPVNGTSQE